MERPTLAVYLFGYNLNQIVYPWQAAIGSALALADRVYFCECYSSDDTWDAVQEAFADDLTDGKLVLLRHAWGKHHTVQAVIANKLLDAIGHAFDFALKLDADEVLCEWSFPEFYDDLTRMAAEKWMLGRPHYTHLIDNKRQTEFIYRRKAVISATSSNFRFKAGRGGDACALDGSLEVDTRLEIQHYGKWMPGRRREALGKEISFTKLYADLGFPDPRVVNQLGQGYIDYGQVMNDISPWDGQHPEFVRGWVSQALEREKIFIDDLAQGKIGSLEVDKWW